uniref:Protein similar to CwfJ C-terminus 1/Protein similar to CwfJ C-terminus 2, putative n=1 Tax=Theileria annulata TaxID=5874 RepID=A0A3B0MPB0_THEAN
MDDKLYKLNYLAAEKLRRKILSEYGLESHELPHPKYKNKCNFVIIDKKVNKSYKNWEDYEKVGKSAPNKCYYCNIKYSGVMSLVSMSESIMLVMESMRNCILEDQLVLAPITHVKNTLFLDEIAYTELRNYQKTLVYMFQQVNKFVVFSEISTTRNISKNRSNLQSRYESQNRVDLQNISELQHCRIECYGLDKRYYEDVKCYFSKAIDEIGSIWSENKRLEVTGKTGVRGLIPQGFDYIHVDFSLTGEAMAKVIDNPSTVKNSFSRDLIASVLNLDQLERKFTHTQEYTQAIDNIRKQYKSYDWTN